MKNILWTAASFAVLVSCSTSKYTYLFHDHLIENPRSYWAREVNLESAPSKDISVTTALSSPASIQEEALMASTSKEFVPPHQKALLTNKNPKAHMPELFKTKKELIKAVKEFNTLKKTSTEPKKRDKNKNGFAIAGFILAFFPLLAVGVGSFPLNVVLFVGGFISCIISSIIGLRSEKRGLAIAGLILGVITTALVIIGIAVALSSI